MQKLTQTLLIAAGALLGSAAQTQAADLFSVTLLETGGAGYTATAGDSSLIDLLKNAISNKDAFVYFAEGSFGASPIDFTGALTYYGVKDAIKLSANGGEIAVEIPSINFNRRFGDASGSRDDAYEEIEDWLLDSGSKTYSKFLKEMAKQSLLSLTDGNPNATTARAASRAYYHLGFSSLEDLFLWPLDAKEGETKMCKDQNCGCAGDNRHYSGIALQFSASDFKAGDFKGQTFDFDIPWRAHCGRRVDIAMDINFNGTSIEEAWAGGLGTHFALPIYIIKADQPGDRWSWRIAPFAGADLRASYDTLDMCTLLSAGGVSSLDFRVTNWFAISLVNQASMHNSLQLPVTFDLDDDDDDNTGGYYTPGDEEEGSGLGAKLSQLILKNGIRASFGPASWFMADVHFTETNFMKDTHMKNYHTVGAALRWRPLRDWRLSLGANYDFGKEYTAVSASVVSVWSF
jgi:hypothetical protein